MLSMAARISPGAFGRQLHRFSGALAQEAKPSLDFRRDHLGAADLFDARGEERVAGTNSLMRKRRAPRQIT